MDNLDDLEDDKWWKQQLTRWDNLSVVAKKLIVRVVTGAGIMACWAVLRLLAGCDPLSRSVLRC